MLLKRDFEIHSLNLALILAKNNSLSNTIIVSWLATKNVAVYIIRSCKCQDELYGYAIDQRLS